MLEQLSVSLALDIIYVYGTVNGVEADFTLSAPGTWTATVPRAEDGRYDVSITAYNSLGTPGVYTTTIHKLGELLPLKTNWAAVDSYGADDLNRIEANTQYIADSLALVGYPISLEQTRTDRDIAGIEFADSLSRVERNIASMAAGFIAPPGYQPAKVWAALQAFDWRDANRLERNLQLLYQWRTNVTAGYRYCGTFACGEGGEIY